MFSKDIGIDLGTANVLIYVKKEGVVLNEPSVVALSSETRKILAVGSEAKEMLGRTPVKINAIKPMKEGVIADFEITEIMLSEFIKKCKAKNFINKPKILICCPSKITSGSMVIDIGGGTTDIAILSLGDIVISTSIKIAGNSFDNEIMKYIKNKYKLLIGERTAEEIKLKIGTVYSNKKKEKMEVRGRNIVTGLPNTITISSEEIEEALKDNIKLIIHHTKSILEQAPPELSADIIDKGIVLTGGGSLLDGIDKVLSKELDIPVYIAENPLTCVAEGTGIMLDNLDLIE